MAEYKLYLGDCLDILPTLEAESVDAVVTDPPYGLGFMGKDWDHGVPGVRFWEAVLCAAKPGAHLLAFGGTRTFHRLMVAIEDAGWEIRDTIMWVYAGGFPKSLNVSKAIDKAAGAEREIVGIKTRPDNTQRPNMENWEYGNSNDYGNGKGLYTDKEALTKSNIVTAPATPEATQWDGWGTALKPAWEPIVIARKPFNGTVAANVLQWGTGGINVDGCRVGTDERTYRSTGVVGAGRERACNLIDRGDGKTPDGRNLAAALDRQRRYKENIYNTTVLGRWPANVIHDGSDEVMELFPVTGKSKAASDHGKSKSMFLGNHQWKRGASHSDNGGSAARFFYCAKASKKDRDWGLDGFEERIAQSTKWSGDGMPLRQDGTERKTPMARNHHPTVKPTKLMRYLVRLVTPPGGVVLDPFMGSGSTGKAAMLERFNFVGIEIDPDYYAIAEKRIADAAAQIRMPLIP